MRCLGTLEFLCDFYDRCHNTQQELLKTQNSENKENHRPDVLESNDAINQTWEARNCKTETLSSNSSSPSKKVADEVIKQNIKNNVENNVVKKPLTNEIERARTPPKFVSKTNSNQQKNVDENKLAENQRIVTTVKTERNLEQDTDSESDKENVRPLKELNNKPEILRAKTSNGVKLGPHGKKYSEKNNKSKVNNNIHLAPKKRFRDIPITEFVQSKTQERFTPTVQSNEVSNNVSEKKLTDNENVIGIVKTEEDIQEKDKVEENLNNKTIKSTSTNGCVNNFKEESTKEGDSNNSSFGKISELITDEQKQIIETYYKVNMSAVNTEEVQKHITMIDKKNIQCNICGVLYLRMDKCQVHIWGHLEMKPYQCKACDFSTVTISNVRCHIRKSHLKIKPFMCHLCEKRYATAALLDEHLNTHTGARPFKCKLCDFASSNRQMLSYHSTTHKPVKDIHCKLCGKEFYSRGRLRAHMLVHNKDKVVTCKLCSAYLSNTEALEMHYKNVHAQDYVCNVCGKHVKSRKALHNHQNVHAAAKYKCTLCPNVYKSSQILKEHLLKHKGIRKYECKVCGKSFAQQSHLAAHMAVHSNIRFHCPGCDKAFNRHDNMKIHTKRCKQFLANPELKNCLMRRERSRSLNNSKELTDSGNRETLGLSYVRIKNDNSLSESDVTQKTDANLAKPKPNISKPESPNALETESKLIENLDNDDDDNTTNDFMEIDENSIEGDNCSLIASNERVLISENILGPESF